jgi:hypothetical protein
LGPLGPTGNPDSTVEDEGSPKLRAHFCLKSS